VSRNPDNAQPDAPTDLPPTRPHDPVAPDADPLPLPPDDEPHAPVREPDAPMPAGDPQPGEPPRLLLLQI
jgi:hypothetical protein